MSFLSMHELAGLGNGGCDPGYVPVGGGCAYVGEASDPRDTTPKTTASQPKSAPQPKYEYAITGRAPTAAEAAAQSAKYAPQQAASSPSPQISMPAYTPGAISSSVALQNLAWAAQRQAAGQQRAGLLQNLLGPLGGDGVTFDKALPWLLGGAFVLVVGGIIFYSVR